ncbi:MAG: hypothetical protein IKC48_00210 [Clostridia bacterium]|nr:hypothetical protein [Clostridia bacterium]
MARSIVDKIVYAITKKPRHYVEVKNPPKTARQKLLRPQAARQVQYNKWSKRYKVYSGSYLPRTPNKLLKKGWENKSEDSIKNNKPTNPSTFYRRKSTNQWVRNDVTHWHWYNWWLKDLNHKEIKKKPYKYNDKYGKACKEKTPESHIQGED